MGRRCLQKRTQLLLGHSTSEPQHFVAAFNSALAAAQADLEAASSAAGARGGWPPADCFLSGEARWLPEGWWQKERCRAQQQQLSKLALLPFSAAPDEDKGSKHEPGTSARRTGAQNAAEVE